MSVTLASLRSSAYKLNSSKKTLIQSTVNIGFLVTISLANVAALSFSIASLLMLLLISARALKYIMGDRYAMTIKNKWPWSEGIILQNCSQYFMTHSSRARFKLMNQVYPFDFFLRVRTSNSQKFQESPLIEANQTECEEVFPWQFAVTKPQLRIDFVEISNNTRLQILRGQVSIDGVTDQDGQTVAILANRTAKKLCLLTFTLHPYQQIVEVSQKQENQLYDSIEDPEPDKINSNRTNLRKEHRELSQQIAQMNKSIDKLLAHEKNQHAIFNKYLDESTSFIRDIMNSKNSGQWRPKEVNDQIEADSSNILKQISEEDQSESPSQSQVAPNEITSKKWYNDIFGKPQPQILTNKSFRKDLQDKQDVNISCLEETKAENTPEGQKDALLLLDIAFNTEAKPISFTLIDPLTKQAILKVAIGNGGGYVCRKALEVPNLPSIIVATVDESNRELKGCISKKEFEKGRVFLFDQNGKHKGFMRFKHKVVGVYIVQTHPLLHEDIFETPKNQENKQSEKLEEAAGTNLTDNPPSYKLQKRPSQKIQERKQQRARSARGNSQKMQMGSNDQLKSPKQSKCRMISNSVEISYLPFLKRGSSAEPQRDSFMSRDLSQSSSSQFLPRVGLVHLKIDSVSAKLHKNSNEFLGKFIKMSMRNKQPIATEIINLSHNLTWKGKGYVFNSVSPYGQLKIELCNDENGRQVVIGTAKVCLALLSLQKQGTTQFYHEYFRDQNEQQVGQLVLGYESILKTRRSVSAQRFDDGLPEQPMSEKKKVKRRIQLKTKSKQKAKVGLLDSEATNRSEKKKVGEECGVNSKSRSVVGGASAIRTKKYTGRNIIIGRAARFRVNDVDKPGPGDYEVPSGFEKHASEL